MPCSRSDPSSAARTALPTWEHYAPLLVAAGTVADERVPVSFPITGFWMDGAFTKRIGAVWMSDGAAMRDVALET
jgi:aromatic ring-opening dioxygenase catalytic subunit (LigB family)